MQQAVALARKVSATDVTVLLTGETGTGKEVFAQAIHRNSLRKEIDKGLMNVTYIGCHPCTNTCSLKIKMEDILTVWLPATGHDDMKVIE